VALPSGHRNTASRATRSGSRLVANIWRSGQPPQHASRHRPQPSSSRCSQLSNTSSKCRPSESRSTPPGIPWLSTHTQLSQNRLGQQCRSPHSRDTSLIAATAVKYDFAPRHPTSRAMTPALCFQQLTAALLPPQLCQPRLIADLPAKHVLRPALKKLAVRRDRAPLRRAAILHQAHSRSQSRTAEPPERHDTISARALRKIRTRLLRPTARTELNLQPLGMRRQ